MAKKETMVLNFLHHLVLHPKHSFLSKYIESSTTRDTFGAEIENSSHLSESAPMFRNMLPKISCLTCGSRTLPPSAQEGETIRSFSFYYFVG